MTPEQLAAREAAWRQARPGSAFDCLLRSLGPKIGYESAGGQEAEGEARDDDDNDPLPSFETVRDACFPERMELGLFDAIRRGDACAARRLLLFLERVVGPTIHRTCYWGLPPLAFAADRLHAELVRDIGRVTPQELLDAPIDVSINCDNEGARYDEEAGPRANAGLTPLAVAAGGPIFGIIRLASDVPGVAATIETLLKLGCSLNGRLGSRCSWCPGGTALHLACWEAQEIRPEAAMDAGLEALLFERAPTALVGGAAVGPVIVRPGLNMDARNESQWTPLMAAAYFGRSRAVQMLLRAGASATAVLPDGSGTARAALSGLTWMLDDGAPAAATEDRYARVLATLMRAGAPIRLRPSLRPLLSSMAGAAQRLAGEMAARRSARSRTLGQEEVFGLAQEALETFNVEARITEMEARVLALELELAEMGGGSSSGSAGEDEDEDEEEDENDEEETTQGSSSGSSRHEDE